VRKGKPPKRPAGFRLWGGKPFKMTNTRWAPLYGENQRGS
jgi:hypothetical protein